LSWPVAIAGRQDKELEDAEAEVEGDDRGRRARTRENRR
jgi:hypothetical protein